MRDTPDMDLETAAQAERLARARSKSLMFLTPVARHPVRQFTTSLLKSCIRLTELGIRCYVQQVVGNSNLPRARNELVAAFLASEYTDALLVDDDMEWDANDVIRLLASDKDLIGGVGPKKVMAPDTDPQKWCCRTWKDRPIVQDDMGNIEVQSIGTGFLKASRLVFEKMIAAHPEWKRRGWPNMPEAARAKYYQFFRFDADDPDEIGEDFYFCRTWTGLGGTVWADPTIRLGHVGEFTYRGDFTALLEAAS